MTSDALYFVGKEKIPLTLKLQIITGDIHATEKTTSYSSR